MVRLALRFLFFIAVVCVGLFMIKQVGCFAGKRVVETATGKDYNEAKRGADFFRKNQEGARALQRFLETKGGHPVVELDRESIEIRGINTVSHGVCNLNFSTGDIIPSKEIVDENTGAIKNGCFLRCAELNDCISINQGRSNGGRSYTKVVQIQGGQNDVKRLSQIFYDMKSGNATY